MPIGKATVLGERYALEEVIGRGGMADVYRAEDQVLERPVAVKLLRDHTASESERARFTAEARTLARLNHPGLVTVLDAGTAGDQPFLVMELIEGPTLAECCSERALDPARVAAIGVQLAAALAYAHETGIVHRDVKPGNVLLGRDDRAWLADFGIARLLGDATHHTKTGQTIGSPAYLSPEQLRGEQVTTAADVYSLGLVLLEALTGRRAFRGSPTEAAMARLSASPAIPEILPEPWRQLLAAMTALDPAERPTASEVVPNLRALTNGTDTDPRSTRVLPPPPPDAAPGGDTTVQLQGQPDTFSVVPAAVPRAMRWLVAGVVALILLVVLIGVLLDGGDGEAPAHEVPSDSVPAGVPLRLQEPLSELHDAVEGKTP